jgi:hypothetical protein
MLQGCAVHAQELPDPTQADILMPLFQSLIYAENVHTAL